MKPFWISCSLAGLVQSVKFSALVKNRCFRRIEILGITGIDNSATETDRPTTLVPDRVHNALPESIIIVTVITPNDHPRFIQTILCRLGLPQVLNEVIPVIRCEA